jgi:hypothetical protein
MNEISGDDLCNQDQFIQLLFHIENQDKTLKSWIWTSWTQSEKIPIDASEIISSQTATTTMAEYIHQKISVEERVFIDRSSPETVSAVFIALKSNEFAKLHGGRRNRSELFKKAFDHVSLVGILQLFEQSTNSYLQLMPGTAFKEW